MSGIQTTPYPQIPGGWEAASESTSNFSYVFISKQEAFTFSCNGLLPHTTHYLFFENKRVSNDLIKPLNGALGDPIVTDRDGKAQFVFYYTTPNVTVTSEALYAELAERISGNKVIVIASAPSALTTLPEGYETSFNSFAKQTIVFKTTKISELPIKTNYSFAYPPEPTGRWVSMYDGTGSLWDQWLPD